MRGFKASESWPGQLHTQELRGCFPIVDGKPLLISCSEQIRKGGGKNGEGGGQKAGGERRERTCLCSLSSSPRLHPIWGICRAKSNRLILLKRNKKMDGWEGRREATTLPPVDDEDRK